MTNDQHDQHERVASAVAAACTCLALTSCSGSSTSSGSTCADPAGLYDYAFSNGQTNDAQYCPLPHDFEQVLPSNSATPFGCGVSASNTAHNSCSASVEESCPVTTFDGYSGVVTSIGTVDGNADASIVKGHVDMKLVYGSGQGSCSAHWDFTATRVHQ